VFNANKKSITLNLKSPRGLALVKDMLRRADVCVENYAPGTIERLGLGYDVVRDLNPRIIYAQVKGFGEGSPFEHNLAFDMIAQACGGTFSVTGAPDGPPTRPGISLGDTGTGMLMAITILGALRKRDATGQGSRLQVAMQDAIMHYMRINFATQGLTGKPAQRGGDKVPGVNNAPMGLYPCKPGGPNDYVYLMTSRANPDHWDRLLKLIGREDLIGDALYATPADRVEREPEVDAVIAAWTRHHTKHEAMRLIGDAGIPAGAVLDTMELQNDPSFEQRGIMQVMHHKVHGDFKMPGWPVRVDGKPSRIAPSPVLGEHTDDVLGTWLGLSEADIASLRRDGAL
jgi:formyl-CoA transferase